MDTLPRPPYDTELVALQEAHIAETAARDPQLAERMKQSYVVTLDKPTQIRATTARRDLEIRQELEARLPALGIEHIDVTYSGLEGHPDVTVAVFRSRETGPNAPAWARLAATAHRNHCRTVAGLQ